MAAHIVTNWSELAAAVAAASEEGDEIVLNAATFIAISNVTVNKSLSFRNDPSHHTVTFDYSGGFRLLFAGAGGTLKSIHWHARCIMDGGGAPGSYGVSANSVFGPLHLEMAHLAVRNITGEGGGFAATNSGGASTFAYTIVLRECAVADVGAPGSNADGYNTHAINAGAVAGVMRLYDCTAERCADEVISAHEGTGIEVYGGSFDGRLYSISAGTTIYAEGAEFSNPADSTAAAMIRDAASVVHTFVRCKITQNAPVQIIDCFGTMIFRDCEVVYANEALPGYVAYLRPGGDYTFHRCKIDAAAATTTANSKRLFQGDATGTMSIEGCCIFAARPGAGYTHNVVEIKADMTASVIHNTFVGRKDLAAGVLYAIHDWEVTAAVWGNIFAGFDRAIRDVSDSYVNSLVSGYNLFYSGVHTELDCTTPVEFGSPQATDIVGDPVFDWDGVSPMIWDDLKVADDGAAANVDSDPAYQILSYSLTVLGTLGGEPTTLAWDAKEPASAEAKIDLGCYTNRNTTKRTVTQEVTLDRHRFVTVALSAPAALGEAAPVM